jgi:hypothetical protein
VGIVVETGHRGVTSRGLDAGAADCHVNLLSTAATFAGRQLLSHRCILPRVGTNLDNRTTRENIGVALSIKRISKKTGVQWCVLVFVR